MNDINTQRLINDFPEIYAKHGYNPAYPVYFGVGDGWFSLLYKLSSDIVNHIKKKPEAIISITDIKEKFAGLRYYYNGGDDFISDLIDKAEDDSLKTCEHCGDPGEVVSSGYWVSARCIKCRNENDVPVKNNEDDQLPETD